MRDRVLAGALVVPFVMGAAAAPEHPGHVELTFRDPEIVESSGLAVQGDALATTNDSGDTGRVFTVDRGSGRTVGVTTWSDDPVDVEALAPAGPGHVWVGDIGDNTGSRDTVEVARVPLAAGDHRVDVPAYPLTYPGGPADAETLLSDPTTGRLYVATKDVFGGELYAAPARLDPDDPNRLRPIGPVLPIATDGAFFPDGEHLVLRDYTRAVVYAFPSLRQVATFTLPDQRQGEGIAVDADGTVLVSSEGQHEPVLRVPLPAGVRRVVAPAGPSGTTSPDRSAGPSTGSAAAPDTREDQDPQPDGTDRPAWPWFLTGWLALGALVLAARWIGGRRPRG